ncbi:MAG: SWIM zinc finger family protein, partial [Microvirga sp.]
MAKLRKKGYPVSPVRIEGRTIAGTFWGKAWCENLESYRDYENRLPRGRTYVRNGSVVDLQITPLEATAMVSGSELYTVKISIKAMPRSQWQCLCRDCAGGIDSLVELLQGRFSKGVMERLCRQDNGLFPKPSEIRFSCSCPDSASMCKHVAAVLYGVGSRLDEQPELLFRLRAVDHSELVADLDTAVPLSKTAPAAGKVLETDDLSALFGLD